VKHGETLSQIAAEALKHPRMWPVLWEQNEHIINPLNLKVIARYDATGAVLAAETDYVCLSQGCTTGINTGNIY
jgi:hypothetical protein